MTLPQLTPRLRSLPPMLHIYELNSTSSFSKAPRGLFVRVWEGRIFTAISISPSPLLRQRSSRYAFRAGRLSSGEEFRYLRTVIVTAAIDQDFGHELHPYGLTHFFNLLALGRRQPLYIILRFSRDLCFC